MAWADWWSELMRTGAVHSRARLWWVSLPNDTRKQNMLSVNCLCNPLSNQGCGMQSCVYKSVCSLRVSSESACAHACACVCAGGRAGSACEWACVHMAKMIRLWLYRLSSLLRLHTTLSSLRCLSLQSMRTLHDCVQEWAGKHVHAGGQIG